MNLVTKLLSSTSSFGLEFGVIKPRSISSCRCFSAALSGSFGGRPRGFLGFGDFFVGGLPRFFFPSEPGVGFGGLRDIFTFSSESFFCDSESDLPLSLSESFFFFFSFFSSSLFPCAFSLSFLFSFSCVQVFSVFVLVQFLVWHLAEIRPKVKLVWVM